MSLTSILSYSSKEFKPLRDLLTESFPSPKLLTKEPLKAPPGTTNYMLIGKAFDYLLRFHLEKQFKGKVASTRWVADSALRHFNDRTAGGIFTRDDEHFDLPDDELFKLLRDKTESDKILNAKVKNQYDECKSIHLKWINSNSIEISQLISVCLFLGRLDDVARNGFFAKDAFTLEPENEDDILDLTQLIQICDFKKFTPKRKIILNPGFGIASSLVGGADADVLVDDTLIEIKVTKELKVTRSFYNQLIGYYLLHLLGGVTKHKEIKIRKLGIYFARHGFLWTCNVDEVGSREIFEKAKTLLRKLASRPNS